MAKPEHTEHENGVHCRFSWVYAKQAQHNLYQRMRVRKDPKESQGDPGCSSRTSPLQGKTSAYSCPGSFLVL